MSVSLSPPMEFQFSIGGAPAVGYQLFTYVSNTSIKQATWTDYTQLVQNANPLKLDANGAASVWIDPTLTYKYVLTTPNDTDPPSTSVYTQNGVTTAVSFVDSTNVHYDITAAETAVGVTPLQYNYPPYTILRYYSGAGDYTSALQAAINAAQQANHAMVKTGQPGLNMGVAFAWTIDTNKTGIDFEGAILDAAGFTTGNWCSPLQSNTDTNLRPMLNAAHPIMNATFQGAGSQFNTNVCVYENDTTLSPANCAGIIFRNIGMPDWGTAVYWGAGAFMETFDTCFISTSARSSGVSSNYSVIQSGALNSGERNTLINTTVSNNGWGIQNINGNGVIDLINCSIDYIENKALLCSGGQIVMIGGHIESSYDLDNWVYCTGANSSILLSGLDISVAADKTAFAISYSDSSVVAGGIKFQDVFLKSSFSFGTQPLCDGTGIFTIKGLKELQNGQRLPMGAFANQFAYGTFENANYAADWTFGGTTPPARSSAQNHTPGGTFSLAFSGTTTNTPTASRTFPARPGSLAHGQVWNIAPGFANGTFFGSWAWVDAGGNSLSNGLIFSVTSALAAWTLTELNTTVAPAGTVGFTLFFDVFGATSGTQTGYIDDLECTVIDP